MHYEFASRRYVSKICHSLTTAAFSRIPFPTFTMSEFQVVTNPILNVTVSSSISSFVSEKRFQKDLTIAALKVSFVLVGDKMVSN